MIVCTLARKPMIGSTTENIRRYGTGGINLDASRIRTAVGDYDHVVSGTLSKAARTTYAAAATNWEKTQAPPHEGGRWPANLIFQHKSACRIVGKRDVKGGAGTWCWYWPEPCQGHGPERCLSGASLHGSPPPGWTPPSRTETVNVWECAPGCPIRLLDEQSGMSISKRSAGRNGSDDAVATFGLQRKNDDPRGHTDSGTASRFFKQIPPQ